MDNLIKLLAGIIFVLPILVGILLLFVKPGSRKPILRAAILSICIPVFCLGLLGELVFRIPLEFLGEEITFNVSNSAFLLFFVSLLVLLGLIWLDTNNDKFLKNRFKPSFLSFSISFGFIAFVSGQFLIRYIALEFVGLLAAMMALNSMDDKGSFNDFSSIFVILRLGDLSLLASILLLRQYASTLDINQMITAAASSPFAIQAWILGGFIVAVLVKSAVWPFTLWMRQARSGAALVYSWISGILMPILGYYLLYRILPLINSNDDIKFFVLILGIGSILITFFDRIIKPRKFDRFVNMGGLYGSFLLFAAGFASKDQLKYFIIGLVIYRFLVLLSERSPSKFFSKMTIFFQLGVNILFGAACFGNGSHFLIIVWLGLSLMAALWDQKLEQTDHFVKFKPGFSNDFLKNGSYHWLEKTATWINQRVEFDIFTNGVYGLARVLKKFAVWINDKVEHSFFTEGFFRLSDLIQNSAGWISDRVEQGLEELWSWMGQSLLTISQKTFINFEVDNIQKSEVLLDNAMNSLDKYEQQVLKKNLRLDLVWIPLFLIIVLVLMISV